MSLRQSRRLFMKKIGVAFATTIVAPIVVACDDKAGTEAKEHVVEIEGSQFNPAALKVKVGDTITWLNKDIVPHTATAKDASWDTGLMAMNARQSVVVTAEMHLDYYCRFHPMMIGEIER